MNDNVTGKKPSSVEEFEQQFAQHSGVTVEWLHERGLHGHVCECGEDICDGYVMLSDEMLSHEIFMGRVRR